MEHTILITGGAGFIGSHLTRLFVTKYPGYKIVNLDKLTYAGNLENLKDIDIVSPVGDLLIDAPRNWCKNVLLWNLAADPEFKPFTDRGGCPICQGAVTIDKDSVTNNLAYYAMAHTSKFVRPGSVRIARKRAIRNRHSSLA